MVLVESSHVVVTYVVVVMSVHNSEYVVGLLGHSVVGDGHSVSVHPRVACRSSSKCSSVKTCPSSRRSVRTEASSAVKS